MTPDIQELKKLAEAATQGRWLWWPGSDDVLDSDMGKFVTEDGAEICNFGNCETYYPTAGDPPNPFDAAYIAAASPSTILALIEIAEAAKGMLAHACIADADPCDVDEEDRALERRLRTALEGVKK